MIRGRCPVCRRELVIVASGFNPSGVRFVSLQCPNLCAVPLSWEPEQERRQERELTEAEQEFARRRRERLQ